MHSLRTMEVKEDKEAERRRVLREKNQGLLLQAMRNGARAIAVLANGTMLGPVILTDTVVGFGVGHKFTTEGSHVGLTCRHRLVNLPAVWGCNDFRNAGGLPEFRIVSMAIIEDQRIKWTDVRP